MLLKPGEMATEDPYKQFLLQTVAPIAIYRGRTLVHSFVNEAYTKIFNGRDFIGKSIREAFPELEGQPFFGMLQNVFDTGNPYYGNETPALIDLHQDGTLVTRYYALVYSPYKNDAGIIEGVMAIGHDVTHQVEVRMKETESGIRFRNILDQSVDPILILKGENLVLEVANKPLLQLWKVGMEALGKPLLNILPEMKEQGFYDLLQDVYRNGKSHYGHETPAYFIRKDGWRETVYFDFVYQPYREHDDSISGVLVMATNVTEKVLAKRKAVESETNFRNMIVQAPVAMCVLKGPEHIVQIANEGMYAIWGKTAEQMQGKPVFEGLPEAKGQGQEAILHHVLSTGERHAANEYTVYLQRNGSMKTSYVNFVYEAFREGDGAISGIIAVAVEVTEQVLARKKIEYAEETARLAIDSADLGTYEVNLLTDEMTTSPRFNAIWGVDHPTADRSKFLAIIHPDDLPVRQAAHELAIRNGSLNYEARVMQQDGATRWVRVKGKLLYDDRHVPVRLLGVLQDITDQKAFAEALSAKVQERTRALQQVNQRLARSNEELEQFAYVASHDLQEPLRKIQVFTNMLTEKLQLEKEDVTYAIKITDAAKRMTGLIKDLLDYSQLSQSGEQFAKVDLNQVLQNVTNDFELLITQKKAVIQSDTLPVLEAIPLQMNQLVFNLMGNALKFTRKDVIPTITIKSRLLIPDSSANFSWMHPGQQYYEIIFEDNGIGFDQEYADRIFTIFQRLNERSSYGGYGIGLALCRKITLNHGGVIFAKGKAQEGAAFTMILPCNQDNTTTSLV